MNKENSSWFISEESLDAQGENDDLAVEDLDAHLQEAERDKLPNLVNLGRRMLARTRGYLLGLVFFAGLMLGWVVIGRWIMPAKHNADPWDLRPKHQANYVGLVAEDYWHTRDVVQARQALVDWEKEDLAKLLAQMEAQAPSSEARQRLVVLAKALELPEVKVSLAALIFSDTTILLSLILPTLPLLIAVAFVVSSYVQQASLERALPEPEQILAPEGPETSEEPPTQQEDEQHQEEEPQTAEEEAQDEEEEEGEAEKDAEDEGEEEDHEEDWDEFDEEDEEVVIPDILAGLFDDEDESLAALEALSRGLQDINIDDLLHMSQEALKGFEAERQAA